MKLTEIRDAFLRGGVIPAHPLALTAARKLDERRQRALTRYYLDAGAAGIAVGVHTTQFAIRDPKVGLLDPVLRLAAAEVLARRAATKSPHPPLLIAGICGPTDQAVAEASLARDIGYDAGLLSLSAFRDDPVDTLIDHVRTVSEIIPVMGFYLQPAVGGRILPYDFWRRFAEIDRVVAIKMAPFNRYQTLDVVRAVAAAGSAGEIALYTGNDDNIIPDLLTRFSLPEPGGMADQRIVGGLLGHWAVWTRRAITQLAAIRAADLKAERSPAGAPSAPLAELLALGVQVTDANAAFFDAANGFAGCIAGLHEVLRRQRLLEGRWCLDPGEDLSPGQMEEIDRVYAAYPHLNDDEFVAEHRDRWLS